MLARAGLGVTLLEAQGYLGGCAGTFRRKRYRFDAGATVAAGFEPGGPMQALAEWLGVRFEATPAAKIMTMHLPGGPAIELPADREAWRAQRSELFGPQADEFWAWQERTAATVWQLAKRLPPSTSECLLRDATRPLATRLPKREPMLERFVDGLLLITAKSTSKHTLAHHGAAALDFPWRGVAHLRGGMGGIADALCEAIRRHGGQVLLHRRARRIVRERGSVRGVETDDEQRFDAEQVIANLTPWNLRELLDPDEGPLPTSLAELHSPEHDLGDAWGAMVLHAGIDERVVDPAAPLHHQVQLGGAVADAGRTAFISISPAWDETRAPDGKRAVTITSHTRLAPWWDRLARDVDEYAYRKATDQDRLLAAAELAIPGFRRALDVVWAGTPVTYAFYTGRARGWVAGGPMRRAAAPGLGHGLHMVGDAVFPGQSTLAVALSTLRVVSPIIEGHGRELERA
jgi:phytoene dehydrogenase-like protein